MNYLEALFIYRKQPNIDIDTTKPSLDSRRHVSSQVH